MITKTATLRRLVLLAFMGLCLAASSVAAQNTRAAGKYNLDKQSLAIQGYDPVAYFDVGGATPAKGSAQLTSKCKGVTYRFATEANREVFEAAPETYEPAYGGWCAYAMAKGKQVKVDPKAFRVGEGRLLLFVDTDYLVFDGDWIPDEHKRLTAADKNWKSMSGESARKAVPGSWRLSNEWNLSKDSLAMEGYDPVSYFPEGGGKPAEGKEKYQLRYEGVVYRFASKQHLEAFGENPAKYEPQHGGWCSYAMGARGAKVEVDPNLYRMTDGQLHLFYDGWFGDTREDWDDDTVKLKRDADSNWIKTLKKAQPKS